MILRRVILCFIALSLSFGSCLSFAGAQSEELPKPKNLAVLNYLTGWHLDSFGYHPAVFMLLENISGKDLSGVTIKMQGKFTDIHTLEPSTAKTEIRRSLKPHQQFRIALVCPREYELPRDTNFWPVMECKVMIRVGTVGDEGTEYLLVTKVDSNTETQEDAFQKLNELTSFNRMNTQRHRQEPKHQPPPPKPAVKPPVQALKASPESLISSQSNPALNPVQDSGSQGSGSQDASASEILSRKSLPSIGLDFYNFEKVYGLPTATDAKKKDYTWAKFNSDKLEVIVAAKDNKSRADLIAVLLPESFYRGDQFLLDLAKRLSGNPNTKFSPLSHSVRYLPSGRQEFILSQAPGLKLVSSSLPAASPPSRIVLLSRLASDPYEIILSHKADNSVLKSLPLGR